MLSAENDSLFLSPNGGNISDVSNFPLKTGPGQDDDDDNLQQQLGAALVATRWLWLLWPPLILALGTFGNVASVCVLARLSRPNGKSGEVSPINLYLMSLAVSDLVALYTGLLRYWLLELLSYDVYSAHSALCKIGMWIFGTAWNNSTYLLVALTFQRALSVLWPHRVRVVCTRRTSQAVIVTIVSVSGLLLAHVLYGYDVIAGSGTTSRDQCGHAVYAYSVFNATVWVYVEIVTFALLPFLCLVLANGLLAQRLAVSVGAISVHGGPSAAVTATGLYAQRQATATMTRKKKASSTTVTVMVMSGSFVLFTLPLFLHLIVFSAHNLDAQAQMDAQFSAADFFLQSFVMILLFCNFAVNFYLYCLTGTRFRRQFQALICVRFHSPVTTTIPSSARSRAFVENTSPDEL